MSEYIHLSPVDPEQLVLDKKTQSYTLTLSTRANHQTPSGQTTEISIGYPLICEELAATFASAFRDIYSVRQYGRAILKQTATAVEGWNIPMNIVARLKESQATNGNSVPRVTRTYEILPDTDGGYLCLDESDVTLANPPLTSLGNRRLLLRLEDCFLSPSAHAFHGALKIDIDADDKTIIALCPLTVISTDTDGKQLVRVLDFENDKYQKTVQDVILAGMLHTKTDFNITGTLDAFRTAEISRRLLAAATDPQYCEWHDLRKWLKSMSTDPTKDGRLKFNLVCKPPPDDNSWTGSSA